MIMKEKQRNLSVFCLILALSWGLLYPRMAFVEGVCRAVNEMGETISGNCVREGEGILTCGSDRIRIRFHFQDLNN